MSNRNLTLTIVLFIFFSSIVTSKSAAQGETTEGDVGVTAYGLPGIHRIGMPVSHKRGFYLAGSAGFGYTESIGPVDGGHYRFSGILSGGIVMASWLALGVNFDGYYDKHPEDEEGSDSSIVGNPRILIRSGYSLNRSFQLGVELGLWIPGNSAPSIDLEASTLDSKLLFAWLSDIGLTLTSQAGFRWDNSRKSAPPLDRIRPGDRISLGVSDFNALLLGFGASYRLSKVELIGEVTWDVLIGDGAPTILRSPLRVNAGVRVPLVSFLSAEFMTETLLSKRLRNEESDDIIIPIEPRFSAMTGLRFSFDFDTSDSSSSALPAKKSKAVPLPLGPKKVLEQATVQGSVVDEKEQPITSARVQVQIDDKTFETTTDTKGTYRIENVPLGKGQMKVSAEGFDENEWTTDIDSKLSIQEPTILIKTISEAVTGQLRGLVRSFGGNPLRATISIKPLGKKVSTDKNGQFQTDVPPGNYRIEIRSYGYRTQRIKVKVSQNGVSIVNADMRKKR